MKKLTKMLAASAIIVGAVFAAPVAANADTYTPDAPANVTITITPGGTVTVTFGAGVFTPGSALTISFTSTGPVPTSATFLSATSGPFSAGTATSTGAASVPVTIPSNASAPITATVTDADGHVGTATLSVGGSNAGASGLATTGTYISLATVWGAVGLVALGGGFIVVRGMNRKRNEGEKAQA